MKAAGMREASVWGALQGRFPGARWRCILDTTRGRFLTSRIGRRNGSSRRTVGKGRRRAFETVEKTESDSRAQNRCRSEGRLECPLEDRRQSCIKGRWKGPSRGPSSGPSRGRSFRPFCGHRRLSFSRPSSEEPRYRPSRAFRSKAGSKEPALKGLETASPREPVVESPSKTALSQKRP
ncbi:hypothetical protein M885DRAFT_280776 [Pelagophyceae sp. CCMP2097]|nr:hypothetical protein M885DRAFT_280776 [Pelagophyceae sp. CCMP2097]